MDPNTWTSCLSVFVGGVDLLKNHDLNIIVDKTPQINEAIRRIDGDGLTIIPPDLLEALLMLGIEVHHGRTPPNIAGSYFAHLLYWEEVILMIVRDQVNGLQI